jgi:hypothetical protein
MDSRRRVNAPAASRDAGNASAKAEGSGGSSAAGHQREAAEYLADMILELRNLARANHLYTVMVPLEYAYYEAFGVANRVEIPQGEIDRIKELSKVSQQLEQAPKY